MQFHLNGFRTGDPHVAEPAGTAPRPERPPDEVDVLIVGCGPAGLTLATQLSAFPELRVAIVEQKAGPLQLGQADGIACRSVEMYEAFGFSEKILREAYWVNETVFWRPDETDRSRIVRSGRIQDVEDGLSEFPHVILNQARIHDFLLDAMRRSPQRLEPYYSRRLANLTVDTSADDLDVPSDAYPVTVTLERVDLGHEGETETVRARYVVGTDGARSAVRQSIGRVLSGDSANQAWGVMDVLAVTDFPDIRFKSVIASAGEGNILIIPREGGYLARLYIELDKLKESERVAQRNITLDRLIAAAQRIFRPYSFDVKEVAWWSVYEIGQRLTDKFDDVLDADVERRRPRVFIAGDACHTHSPKAGQGMNVSIADAFNLGWKLAAVLRGQASPRLLHTYSSERQTIAKELIDFDRYWSKLISQPARDPANPEAGGVDPAEIQRAFEQSGRYTAGTVTRYAPAMLTAEPAHQELARGFDVGMRFHSAAVTRYFDAKIVQLAHTVKADGRWRLFLFGTAADPGTAGTPFARMVDFLTNDESSPLRRFTPPGADIDAVIDVRAVLQASHRDVPAERIPALLAPQKGKLGLRDYEKVFCAPTKDAPDIFDLRGVDRAQGCVVVVRPDQFVADVLPLTATHELAAFFDRFMLASAADRTLAPAAALS